MSADNENDPDVAAINGASAALDPSLTSRSPARWGRSALDRFHGEFVVNPDLCGNGWKARSTSSWSASIEGIVMVEAGAKAK